MAGIILDSGAARALSDNILGTQANRVQERENRRADARFYEQLRIQQEQFNAENQLEWVKAAETARANLASEATERNRVDAAIRDDNLTRKSRTGLMDAQAAQAQGAAAYSNAQAADLEATRQSRIKLTEGQAAQAQGQGNLYDAQAADLEATRQSRINLTEGQAAQAQATAASTRSQTARDNAVHNNTIVGRTLTDLENKARTWGDGDIQAGYQRLLADPTESQAIVNWAVSQPSFRAGIFSRATSGLDDKAPLQAMFMANPDGTRSADFVIVGKNKDGEQVFVTKDGKVLKDNPDEAVMRFSVSDIPAAIGTIAMDAGHIDQVAQYNTLYRTTSGNSNANIGNLRHTGELVEVARQSTGPLSQESQQRASSPVAFNPNQMDNRAMAAGALQQLQGTPLTGQQIASLRDGYSLDPTVAERQRTVAANDATAERSLREGDPMAVDGWRSRLYSGATDAFDKAKGGNWLRQTWNNLAQNVPNWTSANTMFQDVTDTALKNPEAATQIVGKPLSQWGPKEFSIYADAVAKAKTPQDWSLFRGLGYYARRLTESGEQPNPYNPYPLGLRQTNPQATNPVDQLYGMPKPPLLPEQQ